MSNVCYLLNLFHLANGCVGKNILRFKSMKTLSLHNTESGSTPQFITNRASPLIQPCISNLNIR